MREGQLVRFKPDATVALELLHEDWVLEKLGRYSCRLRGKDANGDTRCFWADKDKLIEK